LSLDEEIASLPARQEYLLALQSCWPEVLQTLRIDVLPVYQPRWHEYQHEGTTRRAPISEGRWATFQAQTDRLELLTALTRWGAQFNFTEAWIFESALDALQSYFQRGICDDERIWWYSSRGFHSGFEPKFSQNVWYPPEGGWPESWDGFKTRMTAEFREQITAYRRFVEVKFGVGKEEHILRRDAQWTARYQKGELAVEISDTARLIGYLDSAQAVFVAIKTFAKLAGIRLRRRGERIPGRPSVVPSAR
jgi:hypothetical protein